MSRLPGGRASTWPRRGGRPLAAATVKRHLSTLTSLYGYAVRRRVIGHSPAAFVETPEVSKA
ncbi:MAG TPA: hypothetical protein VFV66_02275, partial [Nonomuraea sp.]|nr:hypothetical protein [Nonomuraea sp.]